MDKKKIVKSAVSKCGVGGPGGPKGFNVGKFGNVISAPKSTGADKFGSAMTPASSSLATLKNMPKGNMSDTTSPTIPGSRNSTLKNLVLAGKKVVGGAITNYENKLKAGDAAREARDNKMQDENGLFQKKYPPKKV